MITSLIEDITFKVARVSKIKLPYHDKHHDAKFEVRRLPGRCVEQGLPRWLPNA
jgi:hypothetical protein